jgi:hypothetical protein
MPRIITNIAFDLTFNVLDTPPNIVVSFTDQDEAGRETHGRTVLMGAESERVLSMSLLKSINEVLDEQAKKLAEPGSVAARMTAAAEAVERQRSAEMASAALDAQIAAKLAEAERLEAEIATKEARRAELKASHGL